jgi:hypothetical protein
MIEVNERNRREKRIYYKGQEIDYKEDSETITSVRILEIVSMPCPLSGNGEMFREGKAFLCYFQGIPVEDDNGRIISLIAGYAIVDDPFRKLQDWGTGIDQEDTNLLSKSLEEAVVSKIKDLEEIWRWTSLHTLCQFCKAKGEQCKKQLRSLLNKTSFSFSLFSNPGAPKTYMGWKKEEIT